MNANSLLFASVLLLVAACSGSTSSDAGPSSDAPSFDGTLIDAAGSDIGRCTDADGDGHCSTSSGGDDCNDGDPDAYAGNHEVCDTTGHDEDCNPATLGPDRDGDGFPSTSCCDTQLSGAILCGLDCDDGRATVSPTAVETCDGTDDNCNGMIDEGVMMLTCFDDPDSDSYAALGAASHMACACSSTQTTRAPVGAAIDCNDANAGVHPGATDICDGLDNDCNGRVDDGAGAGYYADCDGDGYGGGVPMVGCTMPTTPPAACPGRPWVTAAGDCDDASSAIHPTASEICNGVDDDCNAVIDDAGAEAWCVTGAGYPPHTTGAACAGGACHWTACVAPYMDCDASSGCETDTSSDVLHCGSCSRCAGECHSGVCTVCGATGGPCCSTRTPPCGPGPDFDAGGGAGDTCFGGTCQTCGNYGQSCCGGTTCVLSYLACGASSTCEYCGGSAQPCCSGSSCTGAGLECGSTGLCTACGGYGQPCCAGGVCGGPLSCTNDGGTPMCTL